MNGTYDRIKQAKDIDFTMRHEDAIPLDNISWSIGTLKLELQRLLIHHELRPLDLIRAWRVGGEEPVNRKRSDDKFSRKQVRDALRCTTVESPSLTHSSLPLAFLTCSLY